MTDPKTTAARRERLGALALVCQLGLASPAGARPVVMSLTQLTRGASTIVQGTVAESSGDTLRVRKTATLKGAVSATTLALTLSSVAIESPRLQVASGQPVIAFLDAQQQPLAGSRGVLPLTADSVSKYATTVGLLVDLDRAPDARAKQTVLLKLLAQDFAPAELEALRTIYMEYATGAFATDALVKPALALAQQPRGETAVRVNAVQVLSRIGDKPTVPALIELLADPDREVAQTAFGSLKSMTRAKLEFDATQEVASRRQAVADWRAWWQENQDQVVLIK